MCITCRIRRYFLMSTDQLPINIASDNRNIYTYISESYAFIFTRIAVHRHETTRSYCGDRTTARLLQVCISEYTQYIRGGFARKDETFRKYTES